MLSFWTGQRLLTHEPRRLRNVWASSKGHVAAAVRGRQMLDRVTFSRVADLTCAIALANILQRTFIGST